MTTDTPLWLEIKTEYLDANLDGVIKYLFQEASKSDHDAFFDKTIRLLDRRIGELVESSSSQPLWEKSSARPDILRMLGAYLLVEDGGAERFREAFFFLVRELSCIVPDSYTEDLTSVALRSLAFPVTSLGFGWQDIRELMPEVMAHKLILGVVFDAEPYEQGWFQGKGSLCVKDGIVELYATGKNEASLSRSVPSLPLMDGRIVVMTASGDRLKRKDSEDIDDMEGFTIDYIHELTLAKPSPEPGLKTYECGDVMPVRYMGKDYLGNLLVETVEGDHERIEGRIPFMTNVFGKEYKVDVIGSYLTEGDVFDAKYTGGDRNDFRISETFLKALIDYTVNVGGEVNAELVQIMSNGRMRWWTEHGYPAYVAAADNPGTFGIGETAVLTITSCSPGGIVNATVFAPSEQPVDLDESRRYCVEGMLYPKDTVFASAHPVCNIEPSLVRGLLRMLFDWQRTVSLASERFRILCVCRILAAMVEEGAAQEYVGIFCTYLKNIVSFASDRQDKIKALSPSETLATLEPVILRQRVTRLLQAYGVDSDSDYLSGVIHDPQANPLLVQLAKLIQSSNRIDDVYPAIKTVIKREITHFLSVETEANTDFDEAVGPNLGVENSRQEFKTSFFFPPRNAVEKVQEKTIFRSLCAFLNTREGGTLYLGVNDGGNVVGLDNDMEYLEKKVKGSYRGIDGYIRYITDRARQWFDPDVRIHFKMDSIYEGKVVAINVEPYEHGVVEFDGVPYIRNNSESIRMSPDLRRQIEARRLAKAQRYPKIVSALAEAVREENQVTLVGYSSSSGTDMRQRHLEPFDFLGNYTYVWAYDLDDERNKLFRISRIAGVKIEGSWTHKQEHQKYPVDIFYFQGEENIPIRLELDQLAKNLLVEEYPNSKDEITDLGDGRWLLDTIVHQITGVGRFYTGLIGHVRIIDAPALVDFARAYFTEALESLPAAV